MRKYIKKYLTNLLYEILKEPDVRVDLSRFIVKQGRTKEINVWDIMKSPYCGTIKLKVSYFDHDENIKLIKYIEEKPKKFFDVLDDFEVDAKVILSVDLYTHYWYKGEAHLESHTFTKYGAQSYPDVLSKIKAELFKWYDNHPEMKLWQKLR